MPINYPRKMWERKEIILLFSIYGNFQLCPFLPLTNLLSVDSPSRLLSFLHHDAALLLLGLVHRYTSLFLLFSLRMLWQDFYFWRSWSYRKASSATVLACALTAGKHRDCLEHWGVCTLLFDSRFPAFLFAQKTIKLAVLWTKREWTCLVHSQAGWERFAFLKTLVMFPTFILAVPSSVSQFPNPCSVSFYCSLFPAPDYVLLLMFIPVSLLPAFVSVEIKQLLLKVLEATGCHRAHMKISISCSFKPFSTVCSQPAGSNQRRIGLSPPKHWGLFSAVCVSMWKNFTVLKCEPSGRVGLAFKERAWHVVLREHKMWSDLLLTVLHALVNQHGAAAVLLTTGLHPKILPVAFPALLPLYLLW